MTDRSARLALNGMVVAVSTVLMFLTGLVPAGSYAIPALAGVPMMFVVIESGTGWAWAVYSAVTLLSFLVAADKEAALLFFMLFGCYPILKAVCEKKFRRRYAVVLKLLFFNAAACAEYFIAIWLLGVPRDSFTVFGVSVPWLFLILGNFAFLLYDYALSLLAVQYCSKLRLFIRKWFHFR